MVADPRLADVAYDALLGIIAEHLVEEFLAEVEATLTPIRAEAVQQQREEIAR